MSGRKDKHLYSYKQALSQPYWIQRFNDEFSLKSPLKFSRLIYFLLLAGLLWGILSVIIPFAPFGLRSMLAVFVAWYISMLLADLVVDGKSLVVYLRDYLAFYLKYGLVAERIFINKGQVYQRPVFMSKNRKERYDTLTDPGA